MKSSYVLRVSICMSGKLREGEGGNEPSNKVTPYSNVSEGETAYVDTLFKYPVEICKRVR